MSRYFFHIMNGQAVIDTDGVDIFDMDAMRLEAIRSAGQMLSTGRETWKGDAWRMVVADEAGVIVFGLNFSVDRHGL